MTVAGIDVSAHQGRIDWPTASGEVSFAWMKATEGSTLVDARFAENWSGALYAGVPRGAYHFFTSASTGRAQAEAFLRIYPGGGELPPVLDFERGADGRFGKPEEALAWLEIVERETGVRPMVYCSPAVADVFLQDEAFAAFDLWIAHYGVSAPRVPKPWSAWHVWQRGVGRVGGIAGPVDLDIMPG